MRHFNNDNPNKGDVTMNKEAKRRMKEFLATARELGWSDEFIVSQIALIAEGITDERLADNTCSLVTYE